MTFPNIKPSGYVQGETLPPQHMTDATKYISQALDGHGGGTYEPSSPLIINGAGIRSTVAPVADAALANKAYVDQQNKATYAMLYFNAGAYALGSLMSVSPVSSYSLGSAWSLISDVLTFPSPGHYMVAVTAWADVDLGQGSGNGDIRIHSTDSLTTYEGLATAGVGSNANRVRIIGHTVINVSSVSSQKLRFRAGSTLVTIRNLEFASRQANYNRIIVTRLGGV